ncbi:fumarylacetoacetate hydrolase family protein [Acidaminococcus sp. NSJ-142]|uniref:fumarylacetoacetate hydrolase family protein n=1 Tax=Acidaminococcus TaxID=904 RepID=UPI000CF87A49|nr:MULTISPECIES: fumarylacetoacetate hydrolase family protein [Acidaminococcus]MCD2436080.1 fumarylacetoacetate hydrolase family protein [Acidaminococcus hominis]MCH4096152.1 fumarylacetoacetate hydrolase family protein [Acidaminococcus provencensis]RHK00613.1 FAA hydrolase family protein [Acidaminococcus sp. AM05-11]
MKIVTFVYDNDEQVGIISEDQKHVIPANKFSNLYDLLKHSNFEELLAIARMEMGAVPLDKVKLLAPITQPRNDIICLGINYRAHDEELPKDFDPEKIRERNVPVYFSKRANRCVDPDGYIDGHFGFVEKLDYECELAVIIGKEASNVSEEDAMDYVFGYTIINDVSARDLQTRHKQWYFGKSLDTFAPLGPCIVTADEFPFPPALNLQCRVNGELRQDSNTRYLVHGIPYIISELSKGMTLQVGTIIATGTPSGTGIGMHPQVFLKSGDVVECYIEGIGTLRNTVK